jgi:hypothetical protein
MSAGAGLRPRPGAGPANALRAPMRPATAPGGPGAAATRSVAGRQPAVSPSVRGALGAAIGDLYRNSWRLVPANLAVAAAVLVPVGLAIWTTRPAPLVLVLLAGPALAGLARAAVQVVTGDSGEVRLADVVAGTRLLWRRGLALGALAALVTLAGVTAIRFYAGRGPVWTVAAFGCGYLLAAFWVFQIGLWPLAALRPDRPLATVFAEATELLLARWPAVLRLAAVLLAVNLLGAVLVLPVLTVTVAFSSLAAARLLAES